MIIRPAQKSDIPAILSLYAQLEENDQITLSLHDATEIFRQVETYPNYHLYVAEQHGQILGTFALAIMDNLVHLGARSGLIEDVVVEEKYRGHGIGLVCITGLHAPICQDLCLCSPLSPTKILQFSLSN
jgi:N-acetylglutamate synthase-like GNAT family acetyltransferase